MTRIVLAFVLAFAVQAIYADVLLIEEVRQADRMELPKNGQKKADVEARFGAPVQKNGAVGDPPITRWEYQTFIVYFENQTVIHAVDKRSTSS